MGMFGRKARDGEGYIGVCSCSICRYRYDAQADTMAGLVEHLEAIVASDKERHEEISDSGGAE